MSMITVPRSDVTAEEVSAVLRRELGSRYTVTPSMMATGFGKELQGTPNTVLVAANWLERANIELTAKANGTEIDVSPGATYFGLIRLIHRAGLVRKVHKALEHAPDFARPDGET
jgi:hypothetical protein